MFHLYVQSCLQVSLAGKWLCMFLFWFDGRDNQHPFTYAYSSFPLLISSFKLIQFYHLFLKKKKRNKEKYKGYGRHYSIPSVKLKLKHIAICLLKKLASMIVYTYPATLSGFKPKLKTPQKGVFWSHSLWDCVLNFRLRLNMDKYTVCSFTWFFNYW